MNRRPLNADDANQLTRLWNNIQLLVSENYGAGRLVKDKQDVYWIQRIIDENLLWPDEAELVLGLGVALGEALIGSVPGLRWVTADEDDPTLQLLHVDSDRSVDAISLITVPFCQGEKVDVQDAYDRVATSFS